VKAATWAGPIPAQVDVSGVNCAWVRTTDWRRSTPWGANDDEGAVGRLVTSVACVCELVERAHELAAIARLDGFFHLGNRRHDGGPDHLADRHLLVDGKVLDHVLKAFLQLVDLVVRHVPVAHVARKPELGSSLTYLRMVLMCVK